MPLPFADLGDVVRISQAAERLGYHSVWGNDHITAPRYVREAHANQPRFFEPLITLAYVAAHTTTIRLGTAVLVMPMREPVYLAKQVATLDHASHGRVLLGVGVGAYREELEAIKPTMPRLTDIFQTYLRELRVSDLNGSAGLFRLKEELTRRVNTVISPSQVNAVLFKEIVIQ